MATAAVEATMAGARSRRESEVREARELSGDQLHLRCVVVGVSSWRPGTHWHRGWRAYPSGLGIPSTIVAAVNRVAEISVVVGEDHPIFREGLVRVLEGGGFDVVAVADDARDVIRRTRAHRPDVVVIDIRMPPDQQDDGLRAALEIRASDPDIGVLVLSEFLEDRYALDLVGTGPRVSATFSRTRWATWRRSPTRCVVRTRGLRWIRTWSRALLGRKRINSPLDTLTKREREVLSLMAEGRCDAGIAEKMVVSVRRCRRHIASVFDKLGLRRSSEQHRRVLGSSKYPDPRGDLALWLSEQGSAVAVAVARAGFSPRRLARRSARFRVSDLIRFGRHQDDWNSQGVSGKGSCDLEPVPSRKIDVEQHAIGACPLVAASASSPSAASPNSSRPRIARSLPLRRGTEGCHPPPKCELTPDQPDSAGARSQCGQTPQFPVFVILAGRLLNPVGITPRRLGRAPAPPLRSPPSRTGRNAAIVRRKITQRVAGDS